MVFVDSSCRETAKNTAQKPGAKCNIFIFSTFCKRFSTCKKKQSEGAKKKNPRGGWVLILEATFCYLAVGITSPKSWETLRLRGHLLPTHLGAPPPTAALCFFRPYQACQVQVQVQGALEKERKQATNLVPTCLPACLFEGRCRKTKQTKRRAYLLLLFYCGFLGFVGKYLCGVC
jgi:hypothetical protein